MMGEPTKSISHWQQGMKNTFHMPLGMLGRLSISKAQTHRLRTLGNIVYANEEEEPELHLPTWIALGSIYLLLAGQGLGFQGPPAVVSSSLSKKNLSNQDF